MLATLESVFAQTFTDYEIIVINDGSPDNTAAVLKPFAEAARIRYIEQANQGQATARNRGLAEAQGEFIAFLDDDDLWPVDKLASQISCMEAYPNAVMAYGLAARLENSSSIINEETPSGQLSQYFRERSHIVSPGQTLIRTKALREIGGFDAAIWGADDWDIYARLAPLGDVIFSSGVALLYRSHSSNASKNVWKMYTNCRLVQQKRFGRFPRPRDFRAWMNCRRHINNLYFDQCAATAQDLTRHGKYKEAREIWLTILPLRPRALRNKTIRKSFLCALPHIRFEQPE